MHIGHACLTERRIWLRSRNSIFVVMLHLKKRLFCRTSKESFESSGHSCTVHIIPDMKHSVAAAPLLLQWLLFVPLMMVYTSTFYMVYTRTHQVPLLADEQTTHDISKMFTRHLSNVIKLSPLSLYTAVEIVAIHITVQQTFVVESPRCDCCHVNCCSIRKISQILQIFLSAL